MNELIVVEKIELVPFFTKGDQVEEILEAISAEAKSFVVGDLSVEKNRKAVTAMVTKITKSKTYMEAKGKALAAEYKAIPKAIDAKRKLVKDTLNDLQELVRKPLTDWEAEQVRIKEEAEAVKAAEALAVQVANDQEMALLLDDKFNTDAKAELERIEQERIDYEDQLKADAALEATRRAEEVAEAQRKQVEADKQEAIRNEQRAILQAEEAAKREKQLIIDAEIAANQKIIDDEKAEDKRVADVETAKQQEVARQKAEQNRLVEEQKARDEDVENQRAVNQDVIAALLSVGNAGEGINDIQAKAIAVAIIKGLIPNVSLTY